jgi:tetratricopeptide (TPR) repeat protein
MAPDGNEPPSPEESALFGRVADLLRECRGAGASPAPAPDLAARLQAGRAELEAYYREHLESVPALRLLCEFAQLFGNLPLARKLIARAEAFEPWNLELLIISESLVEVEAETARQPDQAPFLSSEISSTVVNPEKLMQQAMGAFRLGDLERAYSLARLAYLLAPEAPHLLLDIWAVGTALDPRRTYQDLVKLERHGSPSPFLCLTLGSTCNVLGLYPEAVEWLNQGLSLAPQDPFAMSMLLNELAYVLVKMGTQLDRCVMLARQALEVFPDEKANGFIRDTLGVAYLKKGDTEKAIKNLREAVSKDPTVIPRFHLALALLQGRDTTGALAELRAIASARPSLESPHVEETAVLERVQTHITKLDELLNLGGADNLRDAQELLGGLV